MSERAVDGVRPDGESEVDHLSSAADMSGGAAGPDTAGNHPRSEQKRPWSHCASTWGFWRTATAWSLVAAWAAWALIRLTGADRLTAPAIPLVPLVSFTPYVAAAAPVPVVCALLLRRRRAALAAGLVAVALAAVVLPRALPTDGPASAGPRLRVLTANLMYGTADLDRLVSIVRRTNADLLSVQELPGGTAERLERAGLSRLLPYRHLDVRPGAMGSGLYSRHPLKAVSTLAVTRMAMPRAELTLPGGRRVEVSAVHPLPPLSRTDHRTWRHDLRSLPAAAPAAAGREPVRILAGDFNATLDHAELRRILRRGYADAADRKGAGLVPTWGVALGGPPLTIDHVLADARCAVLRVEVIDLPGSDHRAVFADLRLP